MFYSNHLDGSTAVFDAAEKRHAVDALRKKEGDPITFTDGKGHLYEGRISKIAREQLTAEVSAILRQEARPRFHLAIAPTKNSDRMEWMVEKCCELGLASLQFLECAHSEKTRVNMSRLERVALSAIKQSGNLWMPELLPVLNFKNWIKQTAHGQRYLAHCAEGPKRQAQSTDEAITVAIGPEGDFSTEEIALALEQGFLPLTLGRSRLRTETAGMVACTLFNLL